MDLKAYDKASWINTVWIGLEALDHDQLSEETFDDIYTAMSWIIKELGYEMDANGDYVRIEK